MTPASARLIERLNAARDDPQRQQELVNSQGSSTVARALLDLIAATAGLEEIVAKQKEMTPSRQPTAEQSQTAGNDGLREYWQTVSPRDKYTLPVGGSKFLGKGTNGKVMTLSLKRDVAVKMIDVRNKSDDLIRYFLGEAEVMFLNESEYQMKFTECYWWLDKLYLIMPLMRFGSLTTLLEKIEKHNAKKKAVPESVWSYVAYAIFKGLEDLHRDNRMHRDLKLDNVLIDTDGRVQLTDFGWSKKIGPHEARVAGTYYTVAPEVAENFFLDEEDLPLKSYGLSADVRSAGVVLVEIATGEPETFEPSFPDDICARILDGSYARDLRQRVENLSISEDFKELILTCLEDDPAERKTPTWLLENMNFLRDGNNREPLQTLIKKIEKLDARAKPQKRKLRN